jgi:hypothetical protein
MVEKRSIEQNPKIVALIGPYELLPAEKGSSFMTEVWLGTEGAIWPDCPSDPIMWGEVTALDVLTVRQPGFRARVLQAETGSTVLAPDARDQVLPICQGTPHAALSARESLIADRLLQYFVDHGVSKESWPLIDLKGHARKRLTPEKTTETAAKLLRNFEEVCTHGDDPVLGRYVEFVRDSGSLARRAVVAVGILGVALFIRLMGLPLKHESLSPDDPIGIAVAALLTILGLWWLLSVLWLWVRPFRLRVGENGFVVLPGHPFSWSELESFKTSISFSSQGQRLRIVATSTEKLGRKDDRTHGWRLPPVRSPSNMPWVGYLMDMQMQAFKARQVASNPLDVQPEQ